MLKGRVLAAVFFAAVASLSNLLQVSATDAAVTESGHQNMVAEHELVATDASDNSVDGYSKRKLSKKTTRVPVPVPVDTPSPAPPASTLAPRASNLNAYELFKEDLGTFFADNRDTILYSFQANTLGLVGDAIFAAIDPVDEWARSLYDDTKKYVPEPFKHFPSTETTGVDASMLQLVSTVSASMYDDLSYPTSVPPKAFDFDGYPTDLPYPELIFKTDNGIFTAMDVPFAIVAVDQTLILAWRGSITLMDWVRDVDFSYSASSRWSKISKVVKVHGGILSSVENTLVEYEEYLLQLIEDRNINQIITTGHSLGGGIAQVANLWLQGSMSKFSTNGNPKWLELKSRPNGMTVRTINFEGPSTILFKKDDNDLDTSQKGLDFLESCGSTTIHICFQNDIVPRMPGNPDFVLEVLKVEIQKYKDKASYIESQSITAVIEYLKTFITKETFCPLYKIAGMYQFIGKVIYYADPKAVPSVYVDDRDTGYIYPTTTQSYPQFRSIEMDSNDINPTSVTDILYLHSFPIQGQGFAFKFKPLYCLSFGFVDGTCAVDTCGISGCGAATEPGTDCGWGNAENWMIGPSNYGELDVDYPWYDNNKIQECVSGNTAGRGCSYCAIDCCKYKKPEGARCGRDDECMKNKCEDNVCGGESLDRSSGICFRSGCGDPTTAQGDCGWDEGQAWMQDYGLVDVEKNPLESQGRCEADYTDIEQQCIIGNQAGTGCTTCENGCCKYKRPKGAVCGDDTVGDLNDQCMSNLCESNVCR